MPPIIPMMFTLCLSLLLTDLQVHGHHILGHHEELDHNEDIHPSEFQPQSRTEGQGTATIEQKFFRINTDFAFRLYKHIAADPVPKNIFIAPLSISTALAMLTLGAKAKTRHQIFSGLGFNLSDIDENEVHEEFNRIIRTLNQPSNITLMKTGNALFIDKSLQLQPKFQNKIKTLYEVEGFPMNFKNSTAAENKINNYIKKKTNGNVSQAVQGLDADTLMVLVNYMFFKAFWENPFDPTLTWETDFFLDRKTTVKVNMMYREDYYGFYYDEGLSCWVVRVHYKGDNAAWFILPDQGKLKGVEETLTRHHFAQWTMSVTYAKIVLRIPKFTIHGSYDLKNLLQKQGVTDVFNDNADLSGMTEEHNLKVSKAVHKTVLDVDEGSTKAAAVTAVNFEPLIRQFTVPSNITINKPFLLFIGNERIYHFVVIAKVMNPTAK